MALGQLPQLQLPDNNDMGRTLLLANQIQANQRQNKLADLAMQRDEEFRQAIPNALNGDPAAITSIIKSNPEVGMHLQKQQQAVALQKGQTFAGHLAWIMGKKDPAVKQQYWDSLRTTTAQEAPEYKQLLDSHPQWDDALALQVMSKYLPPEKMYELANKEDGKTTFHTYEDQGNKITVKLDDRGNVVQRVGSSPAFKSDAPPKPSTGMVKVQDPNSKTGWSARNAAGETILDVAPPQGGFEVSMPDGTTVKMGGQSKGDGATGLAKPTQAAVEKDQIEAMDALKSISTINKMYKPEYQEIPSRMGYEADALKSKMGLDVDPESRKKYDEYQTYRSQVAQNFTTIMKQISGVAINPSEFERASSWIPNAGTGIWNGDDPMKFRANALRLEKITRDSVARLNYIRKNGFSIRNAKDFDEVTNKLPIMDENGQPTDTMERIISQRGMQLEQEVSKANPNMDPKQLNTLVGQKLAEEFGLAW